MSTAQEARRPHSAGFLARDAAHGIHRVVVCLDLLSSSARCIARALSVARAFGSSVTLLHVMPAANGGAGPRATDVLGWEVSRQEAQRALERLQADAAGVIGRDVDVRLEQGHPAERIVAVSRELGADLVVLGTHAELGASEKTWRLGSTTQRVFASGRMSVMIARGDVDEAAGPSARRILVPLDGSTRAESVLPIAVGIARWRGAELMLLHVVDEPTPSGVLVGLEDLRLARKLADRLEQRAACYLKSLVDRLGPDAPDTQTLVVRGTDKRQLLIELAERDGVDLVVLSAHGSTCNAARPFGSAAAHLLSHSATPLLVLQDLPGLEGSGRSESEQQLAPALRASYPPELG